MKLVILSFLILCLLVSQSFAININKAVNFLKMQFVKEASLLRASTIGEDARACYISSDNLLAAAVFRILDEPLFYEIRKVLDKYGGGANELHEILFGVNIGKFFYTRRNEVIDVIFGDFGNRIGPGKVIHELPFKAKQITLWSEYADLIVYKALNDYYEGNLENSFECFEKLVNLWDGHGFRDASYISNGLYETYKLSLAMYLYELLNSQRLEKVKKHESIITKMRKIIDSMQDLNGGIVTNYKYDSSSNKYIPMGDVNVETTCMTLLAYAKRFPRREEISEIKIENGSIEMTLTDPNCIAIVFESPKLEKVDICSNASCREIKRFSKDVDSVICWMGLSDATKNIKIDFESSDSDKDISRRDLKVYVILLE